MTCNSIINNDLPQVMYYSFLMIRISVYVTSLCSLDGAHARARISRAHSRELSRRAWQPRLVE